MESLTYAQNQILEELEHERKHDLLKLEVTKAEAIKVLAEVKAEKYRLENLTVIGIRKVKESYLKRRGSMKRKNPKGVT